MTDEQFKEAFKANFGTHKAYSWMARHASTIKKAKPWLLGLFLLGFIIRIAFPHDESFGWVLLAAFGPFIAVVWIGAILRMRVDAKIAKVSKVTGIEPAVVLARATALGLI